MAADLSFRDRLSVVVVSPLCPRMVSVNLEQDLPMGSADLASISVASSRELTYKSASLFTDFPFADFQAVSQLISAALKQLTVFLQLRKSRQF